MARHAYFGVENMRMSLPFYLERIALARDKKYIAMICEREAEGSHSPYSFYLSFSASLTNT